MTHTTNLNIGFNFFLDPVMYSSDGIDQKYIEQARNSPENLIKAFPKLDLRNDKKNEPEKISEDRKIVLLTKMIQMRSPKHLCLIIDNISRLGFGKKGATVSFIAQLILSNFKEFVSFEEIKRFTIGLLLKQFDVPTPFDEVNVNELEITKKFYPVFFDDKKRLLTLFEKIQTKQDWKKIYKTSNQVTKKEFSTFIAKTQIESWRWTKLFFNDPQIEQKDKDAFLLQIKHVAISQCLEESF